MLFFLPTCCLIVYVSPFMTTAMSDKDHSFGFGY